MRKINLAEPGTPEWEDWKTRCAAARDAAIAVAQSGNKPIISDLYKEQKSWFVDRAQCFRGKFAYCEKRITSTQRGDVEHYRPKGAVQHEDWSPVQRDVEGGVEEHPGYYWLAYDLDNLLLSCILCNQVYTGRLFGKGNRFPVDGAHSWFPGEEGNETRVLLNPCIDDPAEHLEFDSSTGALRGLSRKGEVTISILGLNERDLPRERYREFEAAIAKFDSIVAQRRFRGAEWVFERLQEFANDDQWDFSTVTEQGIKREVASVLQSVGGPENAA